MENSFLTPATHTVRAVVAVTDWRNWWRIKELRCSWAASKWRRPIRRLDWTRRE